MTDFLTPTEFDTEFQWFADSATSTSVFRWEALQRYTIDNDEPSLVAFRTGGPRPERSVRTSSWLRRVATSTAAGKEWVRVRHVVEPLSEYLRWEMLAYVESQAVGEQIFVTRTPLLDADDRHPDFWLFGGATDTDRRAIVMHYDDDGTPLAHELVNDPARVARLGNVSRLATEEAIPLNVYLARPE